MQLSAEDITELTRLEEAMWIAASRYDAAFQQERFAPDFFEFGQSGRAYTREQIIDTGAVGRSRRGCRWMASRSGSLTGRRSR
jgi:hypothetical protein